jgi:hypothetical protein
MVRHLLADPVWSKGVFLGNQVILETGDWVEEAKTTF